MVENIKLSDLLIALSFNLLYIFAIGLGTEKNGVEDAKSIGFGIGIGGSLSPNYNGGYQGRGGFSAGFLQKIDGENEVKHQNRG